jgi:acetyl-CoA carboxylase, biotin carboxylase subunit
LREKMGEVAVQIAKNCDYQNAGTIEFLVDEHSNFYFIEMNTRIQVEHGVTEEITGLDLIKMQIEIAMGLPLPITQKDIVTRGHAIECRINAEAPAHNFTPCPGTIKLYYPPGGRGVRVDSHLYAGYSIPPHYDSMISKLITTGKTREEAIDCMIRALNEYLIRGINTTIPFSKAIMQDPAFRNGDVTTSFVGSLLERVPKDIFNQPTE